MRKKKMRLCVIAPYEESTTEVLAVTLTGCRSLAVDSDDSLSYVLPHFVWKSGTNHLDYLAGQYAAFV